MNTEEEQVEQQNNLLSRINNYIGEGEIDNLQKLVSTELNVNTKNGQAVIDYIFKQCSQNHSKIFANDIYKIIMYAVLKRCNEAMCKTYWDRIGGAGQEQVRDELFKPRSQTHDKSGKFIIELVGTKNLEWVLSNIPKIWQLNDSWFKYPQDKIIQANFKVFKKKFAESLLLNADSDVWKTIFDDSKYSKFSKLSTEILTEIKNKKLYGHTFYYERFIKILKQTDLKMFFEMDIPAVKCYILKKIFEENLTKTGIKITENDVVAICKYFARNAYNFVLLISFGNYSFNRYACKQATIHWGVMQFIVMQAKSNIKPYVEAAREIAKFAIYDEWDSRVCPKLLSIGDSEISTIIEQNICGLDKKEIFSVLQCEAKYFNLTDKLSIYNPNYNQNDLNDLLASQKELVSNLTYLYDYSRIIYEKIDQLNLKVMDFVPTTVKNQYMVSALSYFSKSYTSPRQQMDTYIANKSKSANSQFC